MYTLYVQYFYGYRVSCARHVPLTRGKEGKNKTCPIQGCISLFIINVFMMKILNNKHFMANYFFPMIKCMKIDPISRACCRPSSTTKIIWDYGIVL
jgi:hypothetical protein